MPRREGLDSLGCAVEGVGNAFQRAPDALLGLHERETHVLVGPGTAAGVWSGREADAGRDSHASLLDQVLGEGQ